jgi:hypothetical protein
MRLILLLISVVFIGFILEKQFNSSSENTDAEASTNAAEQSALTRTPKNQQDLIKLKSGLNNLIIESADKRSKSIDQSLNNENR